MGTELSGLEERIANTDTGAITSIQAVYVPADDSGTTAVALADDGTLLINQDDNRLRSSSD